MIRISVTFDSQRAGEWDGTFSVRVPLAVLAEVVLADENKKPLPGYAPVRAFPLADGVGEWHTDGHLFLPPDCAYFLVRLWDDARDELHFPEQFLPVPPEKRFVPENLQKRVLLLSDMHVGGEYFHNTETREKTLSFASTLKPDFVLMAGDITDNSWPEDYARARMMLEKYFGTLPIAACTGNHDLSPYMPGSHPHYADLQRFFEWQTEHDRALGCEVGELKDYRFSACFDGYPVFALNANREGNRNSLGRAQLDWLEQELSATDAQNVWRFIVIHFHQKDTVTLVPGSEGKSELIEADELQAIIDRHGRIIHCSGHTHHTFDTDLKSAVFDEKHRVLYLNGGCAVWGNRNLPQRPEYYQQHRGTGQLIELYENCVITRGFDGVTGRFVPRAAHIHREGGNV